MNNILRTHIVPVGVASVRLRQYAFDVFDLFPSKKSARKAIERGEVLVNGAVCKPGCWIIPGQCLDIIETKRGVPKPFQFPIRVLFEDDFLAVIEKPAGLPVNGNRYRTVENALQFNLKTSIREDALKWPRPVHRLDASTGGLLVSAKTSSSIVHLGRQFQEKEVNKRYRAIVIGKLNGIGRIREPVDNRAAETVYREVKQVPSLKNGTLTLLDLWPVTGRTHQLRRHLSGIGFPVLGDRLYGREGEIFMGKGLFLWAVEISLIHPVRGWRLTVKIEEASKFSSLLKREQGRWMKFR